MHKKCWNNSTIKYLSNFWRTLETLLINYEINLILTWSASWVIFSTAVANQSPTFTITDIKPYVPVVTLWTQDNAKLLDQLKSDFNKGLPTTSNRENLLPPIQMQLSKNPKTFCCNFIAFLNLHQVLNILKKN